VGSPKYLGCLLQPLKITIAHNLGLGRILSKQLSRHKLAGSKQNPKKFEDHYDGECNYTMQYCIFDVKSKTNG